MPKRPLKPCAYPGCPNLVKPGERYCKDHKRVKHREYDKEKRDNFAKSIYTSQRWRKLRENIMKKYGGLCQECLKRGRIVKADVVDHIVEIKDGGCIWCEDNLIPLCHSCHNKKTARAREGRV